LWEATVTTKATSVSLYNIDYPGSGGGGEEALVRAIREKRSPRCLELDENTFGNTVNEMRAFLKVVGDEDEDGHLRKLKIVDSPAHRGALAKEFMPSLLEALRRNRSLEEFLCTTPEQDTIVFHDVCVAVANHPTLLACDVIPADGSYLTELKATYTSILANVLQSNNIINHTLDFGTHPIRK
jgi:hypothetical protein